MPSLISLLGPEALYPRFRSVIVVIIVLIIGILLIVIVITISVISLGCRVYFSLLQS